MGVSATDIITYIGVPLAVLGVMPVLYTFVIAIIAQQHIKRELRKNHLTAVTRTSLMSGTVEVEHPRYALQPLPRDDSEYWERSSSQSGIRGGSWTMFHWHRIVTGRVNYHLKLRDRMMQPQAEIDFERLITFLLDRGAVPNAEGVRLLKNMGLQTPRMTPLLTTDAGVRRSVLVVASPEESDGHLSLSLFWAENLSQRDVTSLPPYWARLQPGETLLERGPDVKENKVDDEIESKATDNEKSNVTGSTSEGADGVDMQVEKAKSKDGEMTLKGDDVAQGTTTKETPAWDESCGLPVRMYIGESGLEDARVETADSTDVFGTLRVDHLKYRYQGPHSNMNLWFACVAITTLAHKGLWKYNIPGDVIAFARKDTMPHGVLVWLGMLEEEETPMTIARREARLQEKNAQRHAKFLADIRVREAERNMPDALRIAAERSRAIQQGQESAMRYRAQQREEEEEEFRRKESSVSSPRVSNTIMSNACLEWLKKKKHVPSEVTKEWLCEKTLYKMLFDEPHANGICKVLDNWRAWAEIGVMNDRHLDEIKAEQLAFCYAGILLWIISDRALSAESWSGSDLAECQRVFRTVYLG